MIQSITVDLIPNGKMPMLHASQYDDGRQVRINLTENRQAYTLTGNEVLSLAVRKADNTLVTMDIANTYGGKSYVEFATTEQMCACAGLNFGEVTITENGTKVGSLNFYLYCEVSPEQGGVSQSEINNLARQVEELVEEDMDDYLSKDEAADTYATLTDLDTLSGVVDTKASTTYVDDVADTKADKSNTYTKEQVDQKIADLPEPMIFKGTLGVGGTIESLPTASAENEGWTYKVITAGTYAGQTAKVGDSFTSDGSAWVLFPCGDTDTDTWRAVKVNGVEKLGNGISTGAVDFKDTTNVKFGFDDEDKSISANLDGIYTEEQVDEAIENAVYDVLPTETTTKSAIANFETSLTKPMSFKAYINAIQEAGTPTPQSPKAISGVSAVKVVQQDDKAEFFRGLLLGTYGFIDLGSLTYTDTWGNNVFSASLPLAKNNTGKGNMPLIICPNYKTISALARYQWEAATQDKICSLGYDTSSFIARDSAYSDATAFKNAMNGVYLIYELATPITPTITQEQFNALLSAFGIVGNTTTINLGQTVYGGYVEQDKDGHRELTPTYKYLKIENDNAWTLFSKGNLTNVFRRQYYVSTSDAPKSENNQSCNIATLNSQAYQTNDSRLNTFVLGTSRTLYFQVSKTDFPTVDAFKDYLDNNDVYICYELATPLEPIDLPDGTPINTLSGVNNVYADSGDIEVAFKETVNEYVDKQIASVQALVLG